MSKDQTKPGYCKPEDVVSPKTRWQLVDVLYDGGEGNWAAALGIWDKDICLALRWNGTGEGGIGTPSSRGYPSWFIVPMPLNQAILQYEEISQEKRAKAKTLLNLK